MLQTKYMAEQKNIGTSAQIFEHEVIDVIASQKAQKPIMKIEPRIRIIASGTSDIFCAPITQVHKNRFPGLWEEYLKAKAEQSEPEKPLKPKTRARKKRVEDELTHDLPEGS